MRKIYTCNIDFDDQLEVEGDDVHMGFSTCYDHASVFLSQANVRDLRDALSQWIDKAQPAVVPPLDEAAVRHIVRDELKKAEDDQ